jgi:hypothetical protein
MEHRLSALLVFIGRSGEPFPSGLELYVLVEALEPLDDDETEADLWSVLNWIVEGVGEEWKVPISKRCAICCWSADAEC